jgi:uncharacterized protein YbjQ (UPF0145 family)
VLVVTTNELPGYEVRQVLGQVIGATARLRNPFMEGIRTLARGDFNPRASRHLAEWRNEVIAQMTEQARERGANAVVAMRFDHREISDVWGEMCAYGTAVYAVPLAPPPARPTPPPAGRADGPATGRARPVRGRAASA